MRPVDWGEKMISKEHAKEILENLINNEDVQSMLLRTDIDAIKCAISVLSEEDDTMEWISARVGKLFPSNDYKCSKCGNFLNFNGVNCGRGDANFCPNCGRKAVNI